MNRNEKRKVVSLRITPSIIEKLDNIVRELQKDNTWWSNTYTNKLGYWSKRKVSRADVLEILVLKEHEQILTKVIQKAQDKK